MSRTLRIALVAEGITDFAVLNAAMESMLGNRSFILSLLQPEESVAFTRGGNAGSFGGGWRGVYRWCLQSARRGGRLSSDPLFFNHDLLVLQLDADVASEDPRLIQELKGVLPCEQPCPPPSATTDTLRQILLSWVGESATPPQTVLCTPSKSMEAWVIAIFFPDDAQVKKSGWECYRNPERRLGQQQKAKRFTKKYVDYEKRKTKLIKGWPTIVESLTEARRFHDDFTSAIQNLPD